jgi:hypothetical protein
LVSDILSCDIDYFSHLVGGWLPAGWLTAALACPIRKDFIEAPINASK